jgi:hypothetical protein
LVVSHVFTASFIGFVGIGAIIENPTRYQINDLSDYWFIVIFVTPEESHICKVFWSKQKYVILQAFKF